MAASPILMPKLGLTMTEGLIAEWRVRAGDEVRAGDVLFVVETDKIATEVEARAEGRVEELLVPVGETVPVGAVVATWTGPALGQESEKLEVTPLPHAGGAGGGPLAASPASPPPPPPPCGRGEGRRNATPYARKLAREGGITLESVEGSGPGGRIKANDVTAYLAGPKSEPAPAPAATNAPFVAMVEADLTALESLRQRIEAEAGGDIPVSRFVARAMAIAAADAAFTDLTASATAWILPALKEGDAAHIAIGAVRLEFRPDAGGNPVARSIAALTIAGDPARLSDAEGVALLEAIAALLANPLKLLL